MKKIVSFVLTLVLLLSLVPVLPVAQAEAALNPKKTNAFITLKKNTSTIAHNVDQTIATVRKRDNGQQMIYYTMTVGLDDNTHIFANYKDNNYEAVQNKQYGLQEVTKQVDAAVKNHTDPSSERYIENYTVVGSINGTGYDMSTGAPLYALVMEGHVAQDMSIKPKSTFFAIREDNTAMIGWTKEEFDTLIKDETNPIKECIGGFNTVLIKNGEIQLPLGSTDANARTAIGVSQDGKQVVMLVVDGKQAPTSEGCDMLQLAQILYEAGCYNAVNLDGGGSTTFVSRPVGESTYRVVSSPCDGAPRAVASSLLVVSTVPSSTEFKSASITADAEYITPNGTINLTASGLSPAGTPVDIPGTVTWTVDSEYGEIISQTPTSAVFQSNGVEGSFKIQMMNDGAEVGSVTVNVVTPTSFKFALPIYGAPYGESFDVTFDVTYEAKEGETITGSYDVVTHEGDITLTLEQDIAEVDDIKLTMPEQASESGPKETTMTAKLNNSELAEVTAQLKLGLDSQVLFDFEQKDARNQISNFVVDLDGETIGLTAEIVDRDSGIVHNGEHSLKVTVDYSKLKSSAVGSGTVSQTFLKYVEDKIDITNALGVGYWLWVPKEDNWMAQMVRVWPRNENKGQYFYVNNRTGLNYDEGHWVYAYYDLTSYIGTNLDINPLWFSLILWGQELSPDPIMSVNTKLTYYIDDYTVDYACVHDDRTMPVIGDVTPVGSTEKLTRENVFEFENTNTVSFTAPVSDASEGRNFGIDNSSAKAYIDGADIETNVENGKIVTTPVKLAPGEHTLKLYISDNSGNTTNATRRFTINVGDAATVELVPSSKNDFTKFDGHVPVNGIFWMDVKATDIDKIQSLTMDLDLNNISTWELSHAEVNPAFKMETAQDSIHAKDENVATVTLTRIEGKTPSDYSSGVIASLPVRAWGEGITKEESKAAWTYESSGVVIGSFFPEDISVEVEKGEITYVSDYAPEVKPIFGGRVQIDTELYTFSNTLVTLPENQVADKTWHFHDAGKSGDKEASCSDFGYTGRTVCTICGAPIDDNSWGTVIQPTGHNYVVENGVRKCGTCGVTFTGEFEGKLYKDGVTVEGWQDDYTYYNDGVKVGEGLHQVKDEDGVERWYLFGKDGVCGTDDRDGYSGYYTEKNGVRTAVESLPEGVDLETNEYYYIEAGLPHPGWLYFRKDGGKVDPNEDKTDDTPETTPDPELGSGDGETSEGTDSGVQDEEQQQAIKDIVAYHVHKDGRVHSVTNTDTRKCVESGNIKYECNNCHETTLSERLWWIGHQWRDPDNGDYYCPVCDTYGKNIAEASLNIMGKHFEYSGGGESGKIRAAVYVYHDGKQLSVRSDKNGHDGYVWYEKNSDIGVATVHIRGEGDYYGELTGTFEIVPKSVTTVQMTETAASDVDHVKVTLTWEEPLGAEFYDVWRYDYVKGDWINVGKQVEDTTFSEELEVGTDYDYRVASRALGEDENGEQRVFNCVNWSESVNGTIRHSWGPETNKLDATCTEEGHYTHECVLCHFVETVTVPATGHKVDEWKTTKEPTRSEEGEREGQCTVCGETVTETLERLPYVNPGYNTDTNPDNKQETTTNPDGSTTTTTTKTDGSVSEKTTQTDGTVTEKNTDKSGVITETTTKPDNTVTEKVTQTDGSATERTTTPDGVVGQKSTDAEGKVTSAEVVIPKEAEKQDVVTAPVEVPAAKTAEEAPEISVRTESTESKKVEIPVTEFGPGTVAIIVHEDGTEEVVRDCTIGENGVVLNVEGDVTLKIVDKAETFEDVEDANHWASNAVEFVAARELFNGTGENKFTPNGSMTRGMMVTVLYRLAYEPDAVEEGFADVKSDAYYSDAVAWAAENGVVNGYDNNKFAPDDNVSREQLVTILHRYAQKKGYATEKRGTLANFADVKSVSSWAADAMSWAVELGLVNGTDASHISPAKSATRAEVATILMRFCEKVVK